MNTLNKEAIDWLPAIRSVCNSSHDYLGVQYQVVLSGWTLLTPYFNTHSQTHARHDTHHTQVLKFIVLNSTIYFFTLK